MAEKEITVRFKETYNNHPVTRTCINMSLAQVIEVYGLDEPDIEWWEVIQEK